MKRKHILFTIVLVFLNFNNLISQEQTAWSWGDNTYGQLGDATFLGQFIPKQIDNNEDWKMISSGDNHSIAIKEDGSLWAWGFNESGQLGNGTLINRNTPIKIGNQKDWAYVSAGANHNVAIKVDGSIYAWGNNEYGQLGLGNQNNVSNPTKIGTQTDWKTVQCGGYHTLALKNDGTLWAWGDNEFGQLGDGSFEFKTTPLKIGNENWSSISAGFQHSLAIKNNGTLWGWGDNDYFQLGIEDNSVYYATPFQVGTNSNWKAISAGAWHSMALDNQDDLWTWGDNEFGQIGNKSTGIRETPLKLNTSNKWQQVETGTWNSYAIDQDGYLWIWGDNEFFQLGEASTDFYSTEPLKINSSNNWNFVSAGEYHIIALQNVVKTYNISGKVIENSIGIKDIEINNSIESKFTNVDGEYKFENLNEGSYTITPISTLYTFSPEFTVLDLNSDKSDVDFIATKIVAKTFDLSGKITENGNPLNNITVSNGSSIAKTDVNGIYIFEKLAQNSYTITPITNGYSYSPQNRVVNLDENKNDLDFVATKTTETFKISGLVTENDKGLKGIEISNGELKATTDDNGYYEFANLLVGSYTITPITDTYTYFPKVIYISLQKDVENANFEATEIKLSVENNENSTIKVYPQPNNGEFTLKLNANINDELKIYDVNGLLIFEKKLSRNYKNEDLKIKLDNISNGVYIIELQKGNEFIYNNLLIER